MYVEWNRPNTQIRKHEANKKNAMSNKHIDSEHKKNKQKINDDCKKGISMSRNTRLVF